MMTEPMPSELLARYLAGDASLEERRQVERWVSEAPAHQAELERLRAVWVRPPAGQWNLDRAWTRVEERLEQPVRYSWAGVPLALAAGVALLLGAGLLWRVITIRESNPALPNIVSTGAGERRSIELADGSTLILAPNSEIRIASFGKDERRVDLTGEGWFEVRHDASRPFRVYAGGTVTQDLGTEFSVRTLPGQAGVRVVLVSGSASLRRDGSPESSAVVLEPRDVAVLEPDDSAARVQENPTVEALVSWRTGTVSFQDAPVDSVLTELSRWYGRAFSLGDSSAAGRRFSGPLRIDNLDEALEVLTLSLGLIAERLDGGIVLR
jgi:transmembrane sensor